MTYQHTGVSYHELLTRFHSYLTPKTYFEIGTLTGKTLERSHCDTIAVDPQFQLKVSATADRSLTLFFQMTSDDFFARYDPRMLFGRPIDLAFLDGLHQAEALLRDVINTERACRPGSVIAMHDCIPMNTAMTVRENDGGMWTGDVWKLVPILQRYRPEVHVFCYDANPTGLVCCTGLNPTSTVLADAYFEILREWADVELDAYGFERMIEGAQIRSTGTIASRESLTRYF